MLIVHTRGCLARSIAHNIIIYCVPLRSAASIFCKVTVKKSGSICSGAPPFWLSVHLPTLFHVVAVQAVHSTIFIGP
jgi:hypothetical protein